MESVRITEAQYNYLLPVLRPNLLRRLHRDIPNENYFIGTPVDVADMRRRLVGMDHIWDAKANSD